MTVTVEKAIAVWITDKLQNIIDLYFGTDSTKGEILTRGIAVYEKRTFRTLLGYHAYKLLRERDKELQSFGRIHLFSVEIRRIITQVNIAINGWVQDWVVFTKNNPSVIISDITGKRSKVLLWIDMSEKVWQKIKLLVDELILTSKDKYAGYYIYPFGYNGDKEALQTLWPSLRFISSEEIKDEIILNIQDSTDEKIDMTLLSLYTEHAIDDLCDINNKVVTDKEKESRHNDIIKQKQQDFIDYVTQQVISDKGYFYGNLRENINTAATNGQLPSITDFTDFMLARAITEAYSNYFLSDDKGNVYDKTDLGKVIELNKKFIVDVIVPYYEHKLEEDDFTANADNTGVAFDYTIPSEEQISKVYDNLEQKAVEIANKLNKSPYSTFTPDDLTDWYKTIKDYSDELAEDVQVNSTFAEPLTEAATNLLGSVTSKTVNTVPLSQSNSNTQDQKIVNWKRYYPTYSSEDDSNLISNWKRYYNGDTDGPQAGEGTIINGTRYYPYEPTDYDTSYTGTRYYPLYDPDTSSNNKYANKNHNYYPYNVTESKKTSSWKRYVPDKGKVASDFLPTYRTFSGHDMVVTVQVPISSKFSITRVIGAFQTISYSIHNAKSPVRVLGDMNPRRYVFGPRMIAGSIVLTVFDRHWMRELFSTYVKIKNQTERYFLMDELPAMNITISCVNEYGHNAKLALYGVTIVNEGQIMSINDVYTENTYEFFALNVDYLDRVASTVAQKGSSKNANVPVENVHQETVPSLGEDGISETVPSLEEKGELSEAVQTLKEAPQVINNYGLDIKYDNAYRAVVDDYKAEKISQDKAASKLRDIENTEKKKRFAAWEKEIYNPKYAELLAYFKLKKSDIKNTDTLKKKLGDNYSTFIDILTLYEQTYQKMKENIFEEASARAITLGFEPIGITVSRNDSREESGVNEIRDHSDVVSFDFEDGEELPVVPGGPFSDNTEEVVT